VWNRTLKELREQASDERAPVDDGSDSSDEDETEMIIEETDDKWDCETILCECVLLYIAVTVSRVSCSCMDGFIVTQ